MMEDVFKVDYTEEFDHGLTEEQKAGMKRFGQSLESWVGACDRSQHWNSTQMEELRAAGLPLPSVVQDSGVVPWNCEQDSWWRGV